MKLIFICTHFLKGGGGYRTKKKPLYMNKTDLTKTAQTVLRKIFVAVFNGMRRKGISRQQRI
jgi:hypothetical protein